MAHHNKEEIAMLQLTAAIELFNQEKYIPAITLAAAAEELFAIFLTQYREIKNIPIPTAAEIDADLYELSKDILGIKNYHSFRNNVKNELKHHGSEFNKEIVRGDFNNIYSK